MLKFIVGVIVGALLSAGYVHYGWSVPEVLRLSDRLAGNLVSTATDDVLYDLDADPETRKRALEVYFANRAPDAAKLDAAAGHPFLIVLHRERVAREARQLLLSAPAFDETLGKDSLRAALEKKFATTDRQVLKRAMLMDALDRKPFLKLWLEKNGGVITADGLDERLKNAASVVDRTR